MANRPHYHIKRTDTLDIGPVNIIVTDLFCTVRDCARTDGVVIVGTSAYDALVERGFDRPASPDHDHDHQWRYHDSWDAFVCLDRDCNAVDPA